MKGCSASQEQFIDLCQLLGEPTPAEADQRWYRGRCPTPAREIRADQTAKARSEVLGMKPPAVALLVLTAACGSDSPRTPVAPTDPTPSTPAFTLSGTVRNSRENGPALADAAVRLDDGQSTSAGIDGSYRFDDVSGAVTVTASNPHHVAASATVMMDRDRTVDFALEHTGEPPYEGTAFIIPNLIEPGDPSSLRSVVYAGRGMREVFDRRVDRWVTVDAYLFDAQYSGLTLEFQVNPEFGSVEAARREVDTYAAAIGRLPPFMLTGAREVEINDGVELFGGNQHNGSFLIHSGQGRIYIDDGFLEEVLFHEAAHVSLDSVHAAAAGWTAAQTADGGVFVSTYGRDNPHREDIAESILPHFAVRRRPERLSSADRVAILAAIPSRLEYFDRQRFDSAGF